MANTTIKDPAIDPFYISKDQYCYTVMETITPDKKNIGKFGKKDNGNQGKDYDKPVGHYSDFGKALHSAVKSKVNMGEKEFSSIKEYLNEYEKIKEEVKQLINIGI
tara:strand:+ start:338 stop:655 length:318 start_codon:yes stop_codon:yes gene_type:complete